jgi:hypothetical protein
MSTTPNPNLELAGEKGKASADMDVLEVLATIPCCSSKALFLDDFGVLKE